MRSCEFLINEPQSTSAKAILNAMRSNPPVTSRVSKRYVGHCDMLMLWGYGRPENVDAVSRHVRRGRRAICWDFGYFGRSHRCGYFRMSIDHWHPQGWLDATSPHPERWAAHNIEVEDRYDENGPIILVGMGPKSHALLKSSGWEEKKYAELRDRFPDRKIIFRPKPGRPAPAVQCRHDSRPISSVLSGASLVVCKHSNVAVEATVLGIPSECEDGAAMWLAGKPFTKETRLDFLRRLCWWQWLPSESKDCWKFILRTIAHEN